MTILTAIQEACPDLGLQKPLSIVDDSNPTAVRLRDFAHDAGDDIARRGDWSRMLALAQLSENFVAIPASFARLVPGAGVVMASDDNKPLRGPLASDQLYDYLSGRFGASAQRYYGVLNGLLLVAPPLSGSDVATMRYVRKEWLINGSTYKTRTTLDSDECLFPERLLTKAVVWRFRRESGLPYQDQMAEWEADLAMELRQDRGVTT